MMAQLADLTYIRIQALCDPEHGLKLSENSSEAILIKAITSKIL